MAKATAPVICIVTVRETATARAIRIVMVRAAVRGMVVATVHARVVVMAAVADIIDNDRRDTDGISSS